MLKTILKLNGVQAMSKNKQSKIQGGLGRHRCFWDTDAICCGTANWQCGIGPHSGGYWVGGICNCA